MDLKNIIRIFKNITNLIFLRNVFLFKIVSLLYKENRGISIFNEYWDNLIILDACRFDFFHNVSKKMNLKGKLKKIRSKGATTVTFLRENFTKKKYDDIVYITANPYVDKILKNKFHRIISVWNNGWDEENHTVLPETMVKYTLKAIKKYPEKRLIIHFIQPHYPYIGYPIRDKSFEFLRESLIKNSKQKGSQKYKKFLEFYTTDIYAMLKPKLHKKLYKKNLEKAIYSVQKLLSFLGGKTIITSDHGESFGEFIFPIIPIKIFGHRQGFRTPALINVPWFVIKNSYKKTKIKNKGKNEQKIIKEKIEQLKFKKIL